MDEPLRIPGLEIADRILSDIATQHPHNTKHLTGFVAVNDPAGMSFQKAKQRAALAAGITYRIAALPEDISQRDAETEIRAAVEDAECGGVVIQLPLPSHLDASTLLNIVPAEKDPDVLADVPNLAREIISPAARTVEIVCAYASFDLATATVAVVGLGKLVGRPVADWLASHAGRVIELDYGFSEDSLKEVDLVILGTGSYVLNPAILKPGAAVIDFGYRRTSTGLAGDLDTSEQSNLSHLRFYTPTPGGTGPILIASLIENFARLNTSAR